MVRARTKDNADIAGLGRDAQHAPAAESKMVIGVDFDNTLISYEEVMHRVAVERGLIKATTPKNKKEIRDEIRLLENGEIEWQKLQALAYGPLIGEARLIAGVERFFSLCARLKIKLYIISHKTEFAAYDATGTNLRQAALDWMRVNKFFNADGFGLTPDAVFFGSTRQDKIDHIVKLGCTHFIDDLEETFLESSFPITVEKVLYAASGRPSTDLKGVKVATVWDEINDYILAESLMKAAASDLGIDIISGQAVDGGRNSRVFKLECSDTVCRTLKAYFQPSGDHRDRQRTEYTCLTRLWGSGIRAIPRPQAVDWELGYAVYEHVNGRKLGADDIKDRHIDEAVGFLGTLEKLSKDPRSRDFGPAAEACFSIEAIIANIAERLTRLLACETEDDSYAALRAFLNNEFVPKMARIVDWSRDRAQGTGVPLADEIDPARRTLSPSDFGFHNAIQSEDRGLVWLDFEYFGWDDPSKMIADIVLHPAMALSDRHKKRFVKGILAYFSAYPELAARVEVVYPLFTLKWCMILLNEFLPDHRSRRLFAGVDATGSATRARQLQKAQEMLGKISDSYENFPYFS